MDVQKRFLDINNVLVMKLLKKNKGLINICLSVLNVREMMI